MRILIHDYSGHPPQIRVSRELSRFGHEVFYLYAETNQTPNGNLTEETSKKNIFHIVGVGTGTPLQKYNYFRRQLQEVAYSKPLIEAVKEADPDVIVCSDTPLFPLNALRSYCLSAHIPFVLWMMDVQISSIRNLACLHLPSLESLVGSVVTKFEKYVARKSDYRVLSRIVLESGGGIVADPLNVDAVLSAAECLINDPETRRKMGRSARRYAERKFDIRRIGREFESIVVQPFASGKFNGQQADLQI